MSVFRNSETSPPLTPYYSADHTEICSTSHFDSIPSGVGDSARLRVGDQSEKIKGLKSGDASKMILNIFENLKKIPANHKKHFLFLTLMTLAILQESALTASKGNCGRHGTFVKSDTSATIQSQK